MLTQPNPPAAQVIADLYGQLSESRMHAAKLFSQLDEARRRNAHDRALLRLLGCRYGHTEHKDGDSGLDWWVFPARLSDERIMEALELAGVAVEGWNCHEGDYDCCGRIFARDVWLQHKGSRVIARQSWGRDV